MIRNKQQADPNETTGRYVHHNGPGLGFTAYLDGWRESWADVHEGAKPLTYAQAARSLFPWHGAGGYTLIYCPIIEEELYGVELCADCALGDWLADPTATFHVESDAADFPYERDTVCDGCSAIIVPQRCPECGDDIAGDPFGQPGSTLPLFVADDGTYALHGHCLAKHVITGVAAKMEKQTYHVNGGEWFGPRTYAAASR